MADTKEFIKDGLDNDKIIEVDAKVRSINSLAEIRHTKFSNINVDWVIDINSYYYYIKLIINKII